MFSPQALQAATGDPEGVMEVASLDVLIDAAKTVVDVYGRRKPPTDKHPPGGLLATEELATYRAALTFLDKVFCEAQDLTLMDNVLPDDTSDDDD